jgi:hypothetical protein
VSHVPDLDGDADSYSHPTLRTTRHTQSSSTLPRSSWMTFLALAEGIRKGNAPRRP